MYATDVQSIAPTRRRPIGVARSKDYAIGPGLVVTHESGAVRGPGSRPQWRALRDRRARARA